MMCVVNFVYFSFLYSIYVWQRIQRSSIHSIFIFKIAREETKLLLQLAYHFSYSAVSVFIHQQIKVNFRSYTTSPQAGGHLSSFQIPLITFQPLNFLLYDGCACLLSTLVARRVTMVIIIYTHTHLYNIGPGFSLLKKTKWKGIEEQQQIYS